MAMLRRLAIALGAVVALVVLGALVPRPLWAVRGSAAPARTILVIANPIHTDIVLPLDTDVIEAFADLRASGLPIDHPDARLVAFGWGSRAFYIETPTWSDLKPGPLFKALTVDDAVMHVTVAGSIDTSQPNIVEYQIDQQAFERLVDFIGGTFVAGEGGTPLLIPDAAYGPNDAFFEAHGTFNALVGCNTWTARALRVAGFQTGWWTPLPQSLDWSLAFHN